MYIEEAEAGSDLCVPPSDGTVIRVGGKNGIIYHHKVIKIHYMAYEDMEFYQSILRMYVIESDSIIKTSNYQLLTNNITSIDSDLITSYFILVPK